MSGLKIGAMPIARMADEWSPYCEADRHKGMQIGASYAVAIAGDKSQTFSHCALCFAELAHELGCSIEDLLLSEQEIERFFRRDAP